MGAKSMRKTVVLWVMAISSMLGGCAIQPAWETVHDGSIPVSAELEEPYEITFGIPDDAKLQESENTQRTTYTQTDGDYEIISDVVIANNYHDAIKAVSGFAPEDIGMVETTRFGLPEYQFAWASTNEEGIYVSRASLVEDGSYFYALQFSVKEKMGTDYDLCAENIFDSFGIYYDEGF